MKRSYLIVIVALSGLPDLSAQSFTSSNLPIVVINTNGQTIADEPKITVDMGVIYNGPGLRNNVTDPWNHFKGKAGIEIRGSSSQMFPKKQYGMELRDDAGKEKEVALLGMPKEADWVLFAPYNDKSLMRDALAYRLARDQGRYASRSKYCELVLNGQYMGIYLLLEKAKRGKDRVNIDKLSDNETSGDNLTGGYLLKIDKFTGSGVGGWSSAFLPEFRRGNQTVYFQYEYPKGDEIVAQQKEYIKAYLAAFETSLSGTGFADPVEGYAKYIDVDSFIDFLIINEVTKNVDGYRLSTFFHKRKDSDGGKLFMGPVWDFNLGFGNANYCTSGTPSGFALEFNAVCPEDPWLIPFWWKRLLQDEAFRMKLATRWLALRNGPFATAKVHAYVDSVSTVLAGESAARNFTRWPVLGQYVWPNFYVGNTFQGEVSWLRDWITQRMAWLDENMAQLTTGIELPPEHLEIGVSPVPAQDVVRFHYSICTPGTVVIQIFDGLGRQVDQSTGSHVLQGVYDITSDLGQSPSGLYFFKASFNGVSFKSGHIVIKK